MDRPLLLYDADCGFCTRAAAWARVARLRVCIRPLQTEDLAALGVSPSRAERELPLVGVDGSVRYGHEAVAAALRTGGPICRAVGSLIGSRAAAPVPGVTYSWVATHRHRLPGGSSHCALPA